jgi:hypothetical protein
MLKRETHREGFALKRTAPVSFLLNRRKRSPLEMMQSKNSETLIDPEDSSFHYYMLHPMKRTERKIITPFLSPPRTPIRI